VTRTPNDGRSDEDGRRATLDARSSGGQGHDAPGAEPTGAADSPSTSWRDRFQEKLFELATTRIWLRTLILVCISAALIAVAFLQGAPASDSVWVYLVAQLGTGLLVGAVGSALVQAFIMSVPNQVKEELGGYAADEWASRFRAFDATLGRLVERVEDIQTEVRAHDERTSQPNARALEDVGITTVYPTREHARNDIRATLSDPSINEIRLLGISLNDLFRNGSSLHPVWSLIESAVRGERVLTNGNAISIRILALDPYSMGARLFAGGLTDSDTTERTARLHHEVEYTADRLMFPEQQLRTQTSPEISLELRLYRLPPHVFVCATDKTTFVQPYYLSRPEVQARAPIWRCESRAALHDFLKEHFNMIWNSASVTPSELLKRHEWGVDRGLHDSEIVNIYTDASAAQNRMRWLLSNAKERVWIQGVSLAPMFRPELYRVMHDLVTRSSVEVKLLILDPYCEQAYLKTYREYLAGIGGSGLFSEWEDYRRDESMHPTTRVFQGIQHAINEVRRLAEDARSPNFEIRLYASTPVAYMLIVDDRALVEQYHFGKVSGTHAPLQLTEEMPLIEFRRPSSESTASATPNPFTILEDHFTFVFEQLGRPIIRS
jgi:hypothetical protein